MSRPRSFPPSPATACSRLRGVRATTGPQSSSSALRLAAVITLDDVQTAAGRLKGVAHRTPVITGRSLDEATGAGRVLLKAENLQRVGAFKFRGAYNAVAALPAAERARGVATVSSGNHAQALSLAARLHEIPAVILMPDDAPPGKVAATAGYGAEIVRFDRYGGDREALLAALVEERGLVPVHPYDDPLVMAGQGTAALELLEDGRSLAAGERVRIEVPRTIADGQQLPIPGELTFPVIQKYVDEVVTVSDAEIVDAMRLLFERAKTVAEPSGASAFAALLAGKVEARGLRVGVTLSGGNVTAARFAELVGCAGRRRAARAAGADPRGARDRPRLRGPARGLERARRGRAGHARDRRRGDA